MSKLERVQTATDKTKLEKFAFTFSQPVSSAMVWCLPYGNRPYPFVITLGKAGTLGGRPAAVSLFVNE